MPVTVIVGNDGSNALNGTAGADLIYGFDPNGPQADVSTINATRVATGLSQPLFATAPPGDLHRLFIVEKTGQIKVLNLDTNQVLSTPVIDLAAQISTDGEEGLLGLAFDPNFAANGLIYVNLINLNGDTEIRRYHVTGNVADPASATLILSIDQPDGITNHKGGWLGFGPDGYLYAGLGDGGGGGDPFHNGQNMDSLLGKMLRLDVGSDGFPSDPNRNYAIPADNPFVGVAGADEIWALGLRNPWRPSFDRGTGDFYIADVGQGAWEEIDIGSAGANYGWNAFEGPVTFPGGDPVSGGTLTAPIFSYDHSVGQSITGGYVYRGTSDGLQGQYFFADFITHRLFTLHYNGSAWVATERTAQLTFDGGALNNPSSFGEDGRGDLYVVDFDGDIFRLAPVTNSLDQADTIHAGLGDDMVFGGAGADRIEGGAGADTLNGGAGADTAVYASATSGVIADLASPASNSGDAAGDIFILVENLTGSAFADTLRGDSGSNDLQGGAGNDTLAGASGNDRLRGDTGVDTGVFSSAIGSYTVTRTGVLATVSGPDGTDYLSAVESLQFSNLTLRNVFFTGDFNGDGRTDIPLQNASALALWMMNGTALSAGSGNVGTLGTNWFALAADDFNGDGRSDLLLQNDQTLALWQMNGTQLQAGSGNIGTLGTGWMVAATGDFNGDDRADILLQNDQQLALWQMNGTQVQIGSGNIGTLGTGWVVSGSGDFNGDGRSDILLQNGQQLALWQMNGTQLQVGSGNIGALGSGWMVAGVADFTQDGRADILLQNGQNLAIWAMNGTSIAAGSGNIGPLLSGWAVAGTGDFDGDGFADILLQNGPQLAEWLMHGTAVQPGSGGVANMNSGWDLV